MKLAILLSFILGACAACVACGTDDALFPNPTIYDPPTVQSSGVDIDEKLKLPVALFMKDCMAVRTDCEYRLSRLKEIKVVNMPDLDKSDNETVVGLCYDSLFSKRVHINKDIVDYADRYVQSVIYHELGHCMYGLDHVEESDKLMSPSMPAFHVLIKDWDKLVVELFDLVKEQYGP